MQMSVNDQRSTGHDTPVTQINGTDEINHKNHFSCFILALHGKNGGCDFNISRQWNS